MIAEVKQGPQKLTGGTGPLRGGIQGDGIFSQLHGRYYEQTYQRNIFTGGLSALTAIANATFTTATTGVTATPIVGLYNPAGSGINAEIIQAQLGLTITALQATGAGPFVWMVSAAAGPISTGGTPFNTLTLQQSGSVCKVFGSSAGSIALTGMTGTLVALRGSALFGGSGSNAAFLATQVAMQTAQQSSIELIDGSIIVPPNAVLALMATTTPVAHSAVSGLLWGEVPV